MSGSPRGVKFDYIPGECVLCFEPDPSKARVLYYAKILGLNLSRDRKGRRKADYTIHFQGWNNSWDRIVPESFVLKNTLENKKLMRKLASIARHIPRNKERMRKIDNILKVHGKKPKFDAESSDSSSDDTEEGGNTTAETEEEDVTTDQDMTTADSEEEHEEEEATEEEEDSEVNGVNGKDKKKVEEEVDLEKLEATLEAKEISLEIPTFLKQKLEEDYIAINKHKKLVKLPATPNVVTILEGYVKNFGINVLCATVEKSRPTRECQWQNPPPEKNVEICKEVMDGLRIFFDFTLPTVLLYNAEQTQFSNITTTYKPKADLSREIKCDLEEQNTRLRTRLSQLEHTPENSPLPKLKVIKQERQEDTRQEDTSEEDEPPPRRMTRHAFAEECQKSPVRGHQSPARRGRGSQSQETAESESEPEPPKPVKKRGRGRRPAVADVKDSESKETRKPQTPPPPSLVPGSTSSQSSSGQHSPTTSSAAEFFLNQSRRKEEAVNGIFNWKMVPDELYSIQPTPPSIVYGPHHLLRMFVKLPELLSQMPMTDVRRKYLVKHLELFLEYLSNRRSDLFPNNIYMDTAD